MNEQVGFTITPEPGSLRLPRRFSKNKLRATLVATLVLYDLVALLGGFVLASAVRFGSVWPESQFALITSFVPLYLLSAIAAKAYTGSALIEMDQALKRGAMAIAVSAGLYLFLVFVLQTGGEVSRLHFALDLLFSFIIVLMLRAWHAHKAKRQLGGSLYSVMVLHDGDFPVSPGRHLPIDVRRVFNPARPDAASFDRLAMLLGEADRVIIKCAPTRRALWAHALQGMNVRAEVIAPELLETRPMEISAFEGRPTLVLARGPLNLRDRLLKRAFDLVFAGTAIIALSPLMILAAIAIKLDSPGPVFFRQQRIGRQNRIFYVLKFRSMRADKCDAGGTRSTSRNDDRVTRVGKFIRRTSIDELPQLFNVLRGEMSVVGPRPHAVYSTAKAKLFWEVDERYWYRHACKPGITGLAQIRGHRGATHQEQDLTDRLEADLEYVGQWSFWYDLVIVLKTVRMVLHHNAY